MKIYSKKRTAEIKMSVIATICAATTLDWMGDASLADNLLTWAQTAEAEARVNGDTHYQDPQDPPDNPLLVVENGVATILTQGTLLENGLDGSYGRWVTSYADIRQAFELADENPDVKLIVHQLASIGGSVQGALETAQTIAKCAKNKPVLAFSNQSAYSAAYWIAAPSRAIYGTVLSGWGSIGTMTTITSYAEALKQNGVDQRVIRSAPYKALGQPSEPITAELVAAAQKRVDYMAKVFLDFVAPFRAMTSEEFNKRCGQGREYLGEEAMAVGLVDAIVTLDELNMKVSAALDKVQQSGVYSAQTQSSNPTGENMDQAAKDLASAQGQVGLLQTQLSDKGKEYTALALAHDTYKRELAAAQAEAKAATDALAAVTVPAQKLLAASINQMTIATGGSAVPGVEAMSVTNLVAMHAATEASFLAKFPGGRISASSPDMEQTDAAAAADPMFLRLVRAASFN